ncbi:MAG: hypothetical protein WEA10_01415 [Actinomycetota bacterium]
MAVAIALLLTLAAPAHAMPSGDVGDASLPGPCPLARENSESVQKFSKRLIRCAVAHWSVRGGTKKAICIARRESGLIPKATSPDGKYLGLYQHAKRYWPGRYDAFTLPEWQLDRSALHGRTAAIVTIRMVHRGGRDGWDPWRGRGCAIS